MNKKILMVLFISLILIFCTAVNAEDLTTTEHGVVNGGVYSHAIQKTPYGQQKAGGNLEEVSFNITKTTETNTNTQSNGSQNIEINQSNTIKKTIKKDTTNTNLKQDTKTIQSVQDARLYTMVYVQSTNNRYGAIVNVSLDGDNDGTYETILENNTVLQIASSIDGTVYPVNENITRVYSDYLLSYNIAKYIKSDSINVRVQTYSGPDMGVADAKIKCIGLLAAYNVSSSDKEYNYWFNTGHSWTNDYSSTTFATKGITAEDVTLTQVATSSAAADTYFNGKTLNPAEPSNYFSENVWNVTDLYDNTVDSFLENEPTSGLYGASFKTVAASLVITNTVATPVAEVSVDRFRVSSNSGDALVYVDNTLQVSLSNTGAVVDNAKLTLNIDNYTQSIDVKDLGNRTQRLNFNYTTQEKGTKNVSITIDYLNGTTETLYTGELIVKYNGYMGKSFTEGENFTTKRIYEGFNTLNIIPVHEYQSASWQNFTSTIDAKEFGLTDDEKIVDVLYYQGYNWDYGYVLNTYQLQINNKTISPIANYNDTKGFGAQWDFPSGVIVYNITSEFKANQTNLFNITRNTEDNLALYTGYIVAIYANSTNPTIIKINEETDLLNTESSGYGTNSTTAVTYSIYDDINTEHLNSASLCVISGAANFPDSNIFLNDKLYGSMSDGFNVSQQQSFSTYEVDNLINGTNIVKLQSINDNLVVLGSILTINYDEALIDVENITLSNSNNFLVNEENNITITLTTEKEHSPINITLKIDDDIYTQTLDTVNPTQTVTFNYTPTINGTKNIEVTIQYINNTSITSYTGQLTAYYNGYMGKSFTGGENFTTKRSYEGKNSLILNPFVFYQSSNWNEFTVEYDALSSGVVDADKIVDVLYYQGYNWNKDLNIDVNINNISSTIIGQYDDSKGFANYNYPSGVVVYNLTGGFEAGVVNNISVVPVGSNSNALYGGLLVIVYANNSVETSILINEGADLLNPESSGFGANSSNTVAYSNYAGLGEGSAVLYVVSAASEKVGESKILVNGKEYASLADNYDSTSRLSVVECDVDNLVEGDNLVTLQSINDNLFAMGTILVISQPEAEPALTVDNITANYGDTVTLKATITGTKLPVNNGKIIFKINGKTVKDENGKIIYVKVKDGIAQLNYTITSDVKNLSTIEAVYSGSSTFASLTSQKSIITVNDNTLKVETDDVQATNGEKVVLTAKITAGNKNVTTGKVVFKVNGKTVKDANGKVIYANVVNGVASVEYTLTNLKAKDYNIVCVFSSAQYERTEQTATLTVTKQ